jgi:hypothetical protein
MRKRWLNGGGRWVEGVEGEEGEEVLKATAGIGREDEGGGVKLGNGVGVFAFVLVVATSVDAWEGRGGGRFEGEGERRKGIEIGERVLFEAEEDLARATEVEVFKESEDGLRAS